MRKPLSTLTLALVLALAPGCALLDTVGLNPQDPATNEQMQEAARFLPWPWDQVALAALGAALGAGGKTALDKRKKAAPPAA